MAAIVADIPATIASETEALFKTSFLRDGSSGKSFAIVQAAESVQTLSYIVYERSAEAFSTKSFAGQVEADAPTFSFTITRGSKYWVVVDINNSSSTIHFEVDPNKRRLGVGAGKKRAAAGEAAPATETDPAQPAPEAVAAEKPAAPAPTAPKSKKVKA